MILIFIRKAEKLRIRQDSDLGFEHCRALVSKKFKNFNTADTNLENVNYSESFSLALIKRGELQGYHGLNKTGFLMIGSNTVISGSGIRGEKRRSTVPDLKL